MSIDLHTGLRSWCLDAPCESEGSSQLSLSQLLTLGGGPCPLQRLLHGQCSARSYLGNGKVPFNPVEGVANWKLLCKLFCKQP